jgi:hypothetical protein
MEGKSLLDDYSQVCEVNGIQPRTLLGIGVMPGEVICQTVEKQDIDFLILGRTGDAGKVSYDPPEYLSQILLSQLQSTSKIGSALTKFFLFLNFKVLLFV